MVLIDVGRSGIGLWGILGGIRMMSLEQKLDIRTFQEIKTLFSLCVMSFISQSHWLGEIKLFKICYNINESTTVLQHCRPVCWFKNIHRIKCGNLKEKPLLVTNILAFGDMVSVLEACPKMAVSAVEDMLR